MLTNEIKSSVFRSILTILLSFILLSCATLNKGSQNYTKGGQPGDILHNYLNANTSDNNTVNSLLANYKGPKNLSTVVEKYEDEIAQLYKQKVLSSKPSLSEDAKRTLFANITFDQASVLFALYPIDTAKWMKIISTYSSLSKNDIYESAITAGLDPSIVFAASASGFDDTATPLINSIGLVIYGQDEESTAVVKFRAEDDTYWREGLGLAWEPIYGSFAGSIVYLEANTTYHIEVTITDSYGDIVEHSFETTTKPNTPPIDPNKIYYLSEIYTGGQLDLEALNIEGSADGYAKIVGDGPVIEAGSDVLAAVNIGNNSYVMLENLTVKGGQRYGIFAKKAHHIWIKGCNVSEYGREAVDIRNGKAYSTPTSNSPINYDSGIYLERSGIAVIEECEVHSPNLGANNWSVGHPKGANALQVWAYHDSDAYRGEFIVRNNRFYGSQDHRFNDVIEGRMNTERRGGFVKNSAIYGNYLAYANDDLIEIDGGQQNVLVYDNELIQGYTGISIAPNLLGPSYLFHNFIHNLGDDRGKEWTAIKAGGLMSKPAGQTFIFENFINVARNGIAASRVGGDSTFWIYSQNNIFLTQNIGNSVGYCIFDKEKYDKNTSINDLCFNQTSQDSRYNFNLDRLIEHPLSDDLNYVESLKEETQASLSIQGDYIIPNFTKTVYLGDIIDNSTNMWRFEPTQNQSSPVPDQYKYGTTVVYDDGSVTLSGNNWILFPVDYKLTEESMLSFKLNIEGSAEIVGIGFETDKKVSAERTINFYGTQTWGIDGTDYYNIENDNVSFPIGQYLTGQVDYLFLLLDYDSIAPSQNISKAVFKNIVITE